MATRATPASLSPWRHLPEYLIEGAGLGLFLLVAVVFTVLLEHPRSPAQAAFPDPLLRRACMGLAMGATAVLLVTSPWGQRSGAHFNPALTLAFFRLGRIEPRDAAGYVMAQFAGAIAGVAAAGLLLGALPADAAVRFAATRPGAAGVGAAFAGEVVISFALMLAILISTNSSRLARWTPLVCGVLLATFITLEAPLSGTSMNPARSLGSATRDGDLSWLWIYFTAPPLGMLLAAQAYLGFGAGRPVRCAKLHHHNQQRCIFRCGYHA